MDVKLAIDLLWVRPKKVGGIESYIRNLLDGFQELNDKFEMWLLVSKDNSKTFEHYSKDKRFHVYTCEIESSNVWKRILWQNINLGRLIKSLGINLCFEPYYCKPILGCRGIAFVTTIHDLQAIHFPSYFSKGKVLWMKFSWWNAIRSSSKIVAITDYVKQDIINHFSVNPHKIVTIYNPIVIDKDNIKDAEFIKEKYGLKKDEYYFTVSSLLPHKNIGTLLEIMREIKEKNYDLPNKLIVSGVGGKSRGELERKIQEYNLEGQILLTPFIEDDERNALYKNCKAFLFPSIFEGFGMPPVEAMILGVPVITTKETCLEEVTMGKATYVDDPFSVDEWIRKMLDCKARPADFSRYNKAYIGKTYLELFKGEML